MCYMSLFVIESKGTCCYIYIYIYLLNTAISLKNIPYDCNTTAAAALSRVEPLVVSRTFLTTEPCNLVVLVVF